MWAMALWLESARQGLYSYRWMLTDTKTYSLTILQSKVFIVNHKCEYTHVYKGLQICNVICLPHLDQNCHSLFVRCHLVVIQPWFANIINWRNLSQKMCVSGYGRWWDLGRILLKHVIFTKKDTRKPSGPYVLQWCLFQGRIQGARKSQMTLNFNFLFRCHTVIKIRVTLVTDWLLLLLPLSELPSR